VSRSGSSSKLAAKTAVSREDATISTARLMAAENGLSTASISNPSVPVLRAPRRRAPALYPGEVLTIIKRQQGRQVHIDKALTETVIPDSGQVFLDGREVNFKAPQDARNAGIETVYQTLSVAPALDIAANMFLGRERHRSGVLGSVSRMLDKKGMKADAGTAMANLGIATVQNMSQAVETLSGGQRQAVAVARAATFATKLVVLDEPTAALGVKETGQALNLIRQIKAKGLPVILISHNMPNVFEVSDRIHIARLGGCAGVITPQSHIPTEAVAIMTGVTTLEKG
jgi:fructose transport system ATP-binding protein